MTLEELRNAVCRHIDENRDAYNETGDECYRAVKEELLHILGLIDTVDHEPVGKDKMTLEELARELRKILPRTRYVTVGNNPEASIVGDKVVSIFYERDGRKSKPEYNKNSMRPNTWGLKHPKLKVYGEPFYAPGFYQFYVKEIADLDLSEYADEDGNVDYSKCIVEVE